MPCFISQLYCLHFNSSAFLSRVVLLGKRDTWVNHEVCNCDSLLKTALFLSVLYSESFVTNHVKFNECRNTVTWVNTEEKE